MSPALINPFRGSVAAPVAPADPTHLIVWLRGDASMYQDSGGTPAVANNDPVYKWADLSGNGNDAIQASGLNKPTLITSAINGQNAVRFTSASTQALALPDILDALTSGEGFIVVKKVNDPAAADADAGFWSAGSDTANSVITWTDGVIYDAFGSTARKTAGNPTPSFSSTYRVYDVYSASADWQDFIDGSSFFSTGTNTVQFVSNTHGGTPFTIGASVIGALPHYFADMWVAEFLFYNHKLSGGDRTTVTTYLGARYGLF